MRTNIRPMMTVSDAPNFKFIPQPHQGQYSFSKNSIQNSMASIGLSDILGIFLNI